MVLSSQIKTVCAVILGHPRFPSSSLVTPGWRARSPKRLLAASAAPSPLPCVSPSHAPPSDVSLTAIAATLAAAAALASSAALAAAALHAVELAEHLTTEHARRTRPPFERTPRTGASACDAHR
uniref:Uncharacterized protein n=1 Tax=Emiliania huxleyi TaxID=2903 RepID=A0A7S3TLM2_EMIHU